LYSLAKLMFVVKGSLFPFTKQTLYSMVWLHFILLFYFLWISFIPIVAIGLNRY
jgi:hypothetical protein